MEHLNDYSRAVNFLEDIVTTLMEHITHLTPTTNVQVVKAFAILKSTDDYEVPQKDLFN